MPRFDAAAAECHVYTFKEGLLSAIAHDLRIRVTRFTLDVDEAAGRIDARFDAGSLRVECAMREGEEAPGTLSDKDKAEIERTIAREVLDAARHPEIRFEASSIASEPGASGSDSPGADRWRVRGTLALHGRTREIELLVEPTPERDGRLVAVCTLHQPDFGIKPYSAMLGTLKIKPDVRVRVVVPMAGPRA